MYEKKSESSHQVTFFLQNRASGFDFLMIFACYEKKNGAKSCRFHIFIYLCITIAREQDCFRPSFPQNKVEDMGKLTERIIKSIANKLDSRSGEDKDFSAAAIKEEDGLREMTLVELQKITGG